MCEWCGHEHDVTALCTKRPTWGRRGFLALAGAAVIGTILPSLPIVEPGFDIVRIDPGPFNEGLMLLWDELEKRVDPAADPDLSKLVGIVRQRIMKVADLPDYVKIGKR